VLPNQALSKAIAIAIPIVVINQIKIVAAENNLLAQSFDTEVVNIYCTSNQDGTGACVNSSTNDPFDCTLIPGQVISCRDSEKKRFSCINYGSNQSNQGYFQCTPKPPSPLRDHQDVTPP
jgi:hypothetical protein